MILTSLFKSVITCIGLARNYIIIITVLIIVVIAKKKMVNEYFEEKTITLGNNKSKRNKEYVER